MTTWRERLNKRYLELKAEKKATQESVAQEIGVSQSCFAHWLNGRRSPDTLEDYEKIAKAVGMAPEELLYGVGKTIDNNSLKGLGADIAELSDDEALQVKAFLAGMKSGAFSSRE